MWRWLVGGLTLVIVAALAMFTGFMFPDRAITLSASGFAMSTPDVAKCQIEAKLLSDGLAAVTTTANALIGHATTEAAYVGNLRAKYLDDHVYEPDGMIYSPMGPRQSDFLPKAVGELKTDREHLDAVLRLQAALATRITDPDRHTCASSNPMSPISAVAGRFVTLPATRP